MTGGRVAALVRGWGRPISEVAWQSGQGRLGPWKGVPWGPIVRVLGNASPPVPLALVGFPTRINVEIGRAVTPYLIRRHADGGNDDDERAYSP